MAQFVEGILFSGNGRRYQSFGTELTEGESAEEAICRISGIDGWTRALDIVHDSGITTKFCQKQLALSKSCKTPRDDWQYQLMLDPEILFPVQISLHDAQITLRSSDDRG